MDTFKLLMERAELLKANPHLHVLQDRISDAMQHYRKPEDRLYWLSIEMLDSFDELKQALLKLNTMLEEI